MERELITGRELAQKILDQVTGEPDSHDQGVWVADLAAPACGTVACLAGWAVEFNREPGELNYSVRGRIERAGGEPTRYGYDELGRVLLGLTVDEANTLFYAPTNEGAVHRLADLFDLDVPEGYDA